MFKMKCQRNLKPYPEIILLRSCSRDAKIQNDHLFSRLLSSLYWAPYVAQSTFTWRNKNLTVSRFHHLPKLWKSLKLYPSCWNVCRVPWSCTARIGSSKKHGRSVISFKNITKGGIVSLLFIGPSFWTLSKNLGDMGLFPPAEGRQLFRRREESQNEESKSKADSVIDRAWKSKGIKAVNSRHRHRPHFWESIPTTRRQTFSLYSALDHTTFPLHAIYWCNLKWKDGSQARCSITS